MTVLRFDLPKNSPVRVRLTGKRNWLKVRARVTDRGNKAEIEESWLLSGPAGWVWEMYQAQVLT